MKQKKVIINNREFLLPDEWEEFLSDDVKQYKQTLRSYIKSIHKDINVFLPLLKQSTSFMRWYSQKSQVQIGCLNKNNELADKKRKQTNLKKFGSSTPLGNKAIKQKIADTFIKRYGTIRSRMWTKEKILNYLGSQGIIPLEDVPNKKVGVSYKGRCKTCGNIFEFYFLSKGRYVLHCPFCSKKSTLLERKLVERLSNYLPIPHYSPPYLNRKEFDIFIPSLKIAIEINGIISHNSTRSYSSFKGRGSEKPKPQDYHYNKSRLAAEHGITLLHIWEHEPWKSEGLRILSEYLRGNQLNFLSKPLPVTFKLRVDFYPIPPRIEGYVISWQEEVWYTDRNGKSLDPLDPKALATYTSGIWLYTKI